MPQPSSEHAQQAYDERNKEREQRKQRKVEQPEDLSAGDEGVDDPTLEDFRDDMHEGREGDIEQDD